MGFLWISTGIKLNNVTDITRGINCLEAIMAYRPINPHERNNLGVAYKCMGEIAMRSGDNQRAEDYFNRAMAL